MPVPVDVAATVRVLHFVARLQACRRSKDADRGGADQWLRGTCSVTLLEREWMLKALPRHGVVFDAGEDSKPFRGGDEDHHQV